MPHPLSRFFETSPTRSVHPSYSPNTHQQTRTSSIMRRILVSHLVPLPLSGLSEKHATLSPSRLFVPSSPSASDAHFFPNPTPLDIITFLKINELERRIGRPRSLARVKAGRFCSDAASLHAHCQHAHSLMKVRPKDHCLLSCSTCPTYSHMGAFSTVRV